MSAVNSGLIEQIEDFRAEVKTRTKDRNVITFQLKEIDFDNHAYIKDSVLTGKALHTIYGALRVKDNFVGYKNKMTKEDWDTVKNKLKEVNGETRFWGKSITGNDGKSRVSHLYLHQPENGVQRQVGDIGLDNYFDMLVGSLNDSDVPYIARALDFNKEKEVVNSRLLDDVNHMFKRRI